MDQMDHPVSAAYEVSEDQADHLEDQDVLEVLDHLD